MTVEVSVAGVRYTGWQRGELMMTMADLANSFDLEYVASGRRAADRALFAGDAVDVRVLDDSRTAHSVIAGYVDSVEDVDDADDLQLRAAGRSKTADLVDCSAVKATFRNVTALQVVQEIALPFGIRVRKEPQFLDVGDPFASFAVQQGETGADAIRRATEARGLFAYAVGGDLVLGRVGATKTRTRLERGAGGVERWQRAESWYARYSEYVFRGQIRREEGTSVRAAAQSKQSVTDPDITRFRPLLIQLEAHGPADLKTRAEVARNQRIGQGSRVVVTVNGLLTAEGTPWRPNLLVDVVNPVLNVQATLVTSTVRMRFGEAEAETSELELVDPIAFDIGKNRVAKEKVHKRGFYTKP